MLLRLYPLNLYVDTPSCTKIRNMKLFKSLAGPGYVILNGIRVLNIIGLVAIVAASVALLIKTTTDSAFFFFDAVTNVISLSCAVFLIVSELNLFKSYFARHMPLLSPTHGFATLSLAMFILGVDILAKLNHSSNTKSRLGLPFWRTVIAAGILCFVLSIINLAANYIFRDRKAGLTARQIRNRGAVAELTKTPDISILPPSVQQQPQEDAQPFSLRRSLHLLSHPFQRPQSGLPRWNLQPTVEDHHAPVSPSSRYSRATFCSKKPAGLRFPVRGAGTGTAKTDSVVQEEEQQQQAEPDSPLDFEKQFPSYMARPDSALHPARSNTVGSYRYR